MLTFITGNTNKYAEASAILNTPLRQLDIDLPEIQSLDSEAIIRHKLQSIVDLGVVDGSCFVEDTSLVFHALGQFPGPLIKRVLKHEGAAGAYRLLADYSDKSATATCSIGYRDSTEQHIITGSITGTIITPQGHTTFGRDSIFLPDGYDQTFAQMSSSVKHRISHRSQALQKLEKHIHTS